MLRISCIFLFLSIAASAWAAPPQPIAFVVEYLWQEHFRNLAGHKAMAAADSGGWGFSVSAASREEAETLAMLRCFSSSFYWTKSSATAKPCQLIASGDQLLHPEVMSPQSWQQPAGGRDRPLAKALKQLLPEGEAKGILLHLHGCNGLGDGSVMRIWADYFNALGYHFYAPLSFAEKRPKAACGKVSDFPVARTSAIYRLRVAQTLRSIAELRQRHPQLPIYLWGHSEGGYIVQAVKADVAGVIVSGEECGVDAMPPATPRGIPYLFLLGENDKYIDGLGSPVNPASEAICRERLIGHPLTFHVIAKAGHNPYPWHQPTREVLPRFVGSTPAIASRRLPTGKLKALWDKRRRAKVYRKAKREKAAVGETKGGFFYISGGENLTDATEAILHHCDRRVARGTNVFKAGQHVCSLVDINGVPEK